MERIVGTGFSFEPVAGSPRKPAAAAPAPAAPAAAPAPRRVGGAGSGGSNFDAKAPRVVAALSRDLNLTPQQAAGIVGQLGHESAGLQAINEVNPLVKGSRGGFGWAQWTGPRRRQFEAWAQSNGLDPASDDANYGFLLHELKETPEGSVVDMVRQAPDARTAGRIFTDKFLRPGIPGYGSRDKWTDRAEAAAGGGGNVDPMTTSSTGKPSSGKSSSGLERIVVNADSKIEPDTVGDFGGVKSFDPMAAYRQRTDAAITASTPDAFAKLNSDRESRGLKPLIQMPADKYEKWKEKFDADQPGLLSDVWTSLKAGAYSTTGNVLPELISIVPGGKKVVDSINNFEHWLRGTDPSKGSQTEQHTEEIKEGLSARAKAAQGKEMITETKDAEGNVQYGFGDAWSDPYWYMTVGAESVPSTLMTLVPGFAVAKAARAKAYAEALPKFVAAGMELKEAQKAARGAAAIAGARKGAAVGTIGEALIGGSQGAVEARAELKKVPIETWRESEAFQALVKEGMSEADAVEQLTSNATTQAYLISAVADGTFGGRADYVLAKILGEGIEGPLKSRILKGIGRGAAAEAIEEAGQSAGEQVGQNVAMRTVEPDRPLLQGVPNAAVSGGVLGGMLGGAIGGPVGAASSAEQPGAEVEPSTDAGGPPAGSPAGGPPAGSPAAGPPVTAFDAGHQAATGSAPKGVLGRALDHGEKQAQDVVNQAATAAGAPALGSRVSVDYGEGGSFEGTVHGYAATGEAHIVDEEGEVHEVPPEFVRPVMPSGTQNIDLEVAEPGPPPEAAAAAAAPTAEAAEAAPAPSEAASPAGTQAPRSTPAGGVVALETPAPVETETSAAPPAAEAAAAAQPAASEAAAVPTALPPTKDSKPNPKFPFFKTANRIITMVDVGGVQVPFYISTGAGGKKNVATGKWYPFFGFGKDDGWFNKGSSEQIVNYYGNPALRKAAEKLDKEWGDLTPRSDAVLPGFSFAAHPTWKDQWFGGKAVDITGMFEHLPNANNGEADTATKIGEFLSKLAAAEPSVTTPAAESAAAKPAAAAPAAAAEPQDLQAWWDQELTNEGRKRVLARASIKRSPHTMWKNFHAGLKSKIVDTLQAMYREGALPAGRPPAEVKAKPPEKFDASKTALAEKMKPSGTKGAAPAAPSIPSEPVEVSKAKTKPAFTPVGKPKKPTYVPGQDNFKYGDTAVFPAPKQTVDAAKGEPLIPQEEADARIAYWKDIAKRVGRKRDNYNKVIISLFDASGSWSKPWVEAGYRVLQLDAKLGNDIYAESPEAWLYDIEQTTGERNIVGLLAATPCTTFASSGARWWSGRHNVSDTEMVAKLFGHKASRYFDTPLEANTWMVHMTAQWVEQAKPGFYVLENPIGRIGEMSGLPDPSMRFDPSDFGNPYTKRTQLWGEFNTGLPTAPVDPVEGSKIQSKMGSGDPNRSLTPEGFAYAFFMANDPDARAFIGKPQHQFDALSEPLSNPEMDKLIAKHLPKPWTVWHTPGNQRVVFRRGDDENLPGEHGTPNERDAVIATMQKIAAAEASAKPAAPAKPAPPPKKAPPLSTPPVQGRIIPRDSSPDVAAQGTTYTDLGINNLALAGQKGDAAKVETLRRGKANNKESMVILDQNGDVVANGEGTYDSTGMTTRISNMMLDPKESLILHHNHPSKNGLSRPDIIVARLAGVAAIYAHAVDGISYRVSWLPDAKAKFGKDSLKGLSHQFDFILNSLGVALGRLPNNGGFASQTELLHEFGHLRNMAMRDAGIIEYGVDGRSDSSPLLQNPAIKAAYDQTVQKFAKWAGRHHAVGAGGRAGNSGHPGELSSFHRPDAGAAAKPAAQPSSPKSAGKPAAKSARRKKVDPGQGGLFSEIETAGAMPGPTTAQRGRRVAWLDSFMRPFTVIASGGKKGTTVLTLDVAKAFDREHMRREKRKLDPEHSEADYTKVLTMARDEMTAQLGEENSGVGWYGIDVQRAIDLTSRLFPTLATHAHHQDLYLMFAGIFSNGNTPDQAWSKSAEAFEYYLATGEVPTARRRADGSAVEMKTFKSDKTGEMVTQPVGWSQRSASNEKQLNMLKHLIRREGNVSKAMDWLTRNQSKTDINTLMREAGYTDLRYAQRDAVGTEWGMIAFGDKLGRYTLGLMGLAEAETDTTVDLWFTRTFRRWTGRLLDGPLGDDGIAAQPSPKENGIERRTYFRLTGQLAREFNVPIGDVQAVLWFFEKRLWGAHGVATRQGTSSSGAERLLGVRGIDVGEGGSSAVVPTATRAAISDARKRGRPLPGIQEDAQDSLRDQTDKLPSGYQTDNPGGSWLSGKQRQAEKDIAEGASHGLYGAQTASAGMIGRPLYLPVSKLKTLPGRNNERPTPGKVKYDDLAKSVAEKGYTDENPVYVMVNHRGQAFLNEGNNRVAVAAANGVKTVKAWVAWRNGGEAAEGAWSPANVARMEDSLRGAEEDSLYGVAEVLRNIGGAIRNPSQANVPDRLKSLKTSLTPTALGAMYLNYMPDISPRAIKGHVEDYINEKRAMDTYRTVIHQMADETIKEWRKYTKLGKDKVRDLHLLMHDSTVAGVDPADIDPLTAAKPGYAALRARYMALPPSGRALYERVRDEYKKLNDETDALLVAQAQKLHDIADRKRGRDLARKLRDIDLNATLSQAEKDQQKQDARDAAAKAQALARGRRRFSVNALRRKLESNKIAAPYFPLGRFGKYYVEVRDASGKLEHFELAESQYESKQNEKRIRAAYPTGFDIRSGLMAERTPDQNVVGKPSFITDIETLIPDGPNKASIMDQLWQRYLRTAMPDMSVRSKKLHRKAIEGYSEDALRVFANHTFHAGHQMAKLKHGLELADLVDETRLRAQETSQDQELATQIGDELAKRHAWVMNPTGNNIAQWATRASFLWYLGASPAAAMVNLAQTPMVGIPIMGARFGSMTKAASEIARASKNPFKDTGLSADEKRAMQDMEKTGLIDSTQSIDIQGVAEEGLTYSPRTAWVMNKIGWAFHKAEVANRRITALAAYRLARAEGRDHDHAVKTATDITWRTHFDYSNSSRPRHIQSPTGRILLSMRSYQMNMLYMLGRSFHQAFKGESAQVKKEARYQIAGILGMQALVAGGTGIAGYNTAFFLYGIMSTMWSAIFGGGDDEDDPFTAQQRFKETVLEMFGPYLGKVLLEGPIGATLNIDLTSRVGMPDLWFKSPMQDIESGKDAYAFLLESVAGAPPAILGGFLKAYYDQFSQGNITRGVETASPKMIKDLLKTWRYATEGLTQSDGDVVLANVGWWAVISQGMGFTPANVAEQWDKVTALKGAEQRIKANRQAYINSYAMAVKSGDDDGRDEALAKIRAFNASTYGRTMPITGSTLTSSLKHRAVAEGKRERGGGVYISNEALRQQLQLGLPATAQ